jgi:ribonuclease BN (tRNA processing enzyme)
MLEVIFLGVGEAFDERLPNTSLLIRSGLDNSPVTLLLDCGFTAPPLFWKEVADVDRLDGIWISHFHGDHSLGLPALMVRFWEEGRRKGLTILGQKGIRSFARKAIDLAYPGFYERLEFPIRFLEVEPGKDVEILGLRFRTAENNHSQRDLALRIDFFGKSIFYSGDGRPTPETLALAKGSQLIIHEAFLMETEVPGHGTVKGSIDMAKRCEAPTLALVHIQRQARSRVVDMIKKFSDSAYPLNVLVPEPGDRVSP